MRPPSLVSAAPIARRLFAMLSLTSCLAVRAAIAGSAHASATEPGGSPAGTGPAHARIVERRADDPIYHRKVDRHAVPAWRMDAPRPLPPGAAQIAGATLISMHGEPGDYIGGNQDYLYTPSDGTFSISGTTNHVSINFSGGQHFWFMDFSAPNSAALTVRSYTGATRYPFNAPSEPGLDVFGDGRGCNTLTGAFRVKQIEFDGSGRVSRFWATFEQHCEGSTPALVGEVRFNADVRVVLTAPLSQHVQFGQPLSFDIHAETADSSVAGLTATNAPAGATFTDHGDNSATFQWTPGFDKIGSHTLVGFQAADRSGDADSATTDVAVDGMTSLTLNSESGDYIGAGQTLVLTPADGSFSVQGTTNHVAVYFSSSSHFWDLDFQAPNGAALKVGTYLGATRYPFNSSNEPGLNVDGDGRGCNTLTGSFVVKQIGFDSKGALASLRVAFEQHCEGSPPALTGEIRWNAAVAVDIRAPFAKTVPLGTPLAFTVSATSFDGNPVTLTAKGLPSGATFTDQGGGSGAFRWTPAFADIGRLAAITFVGTTTGGLQDSATTTVSVTGITSLRMNSDPGEPIGQGRSYTFTPADGSFTLSGDVHHVGLTFQQANYNYWSLDFAAPAGAQLAVGTYVNATRWSYTQGPTPEMNISGPGVGCGTITGQFRIKQIGFNASGTPTSLQVTFEQHCNGFAPALTGELRYNASIPLEIVTGGARTLTEGEDLALDVTAHSFDGNPITLKALDLPAGAAFADHGGGTGTLTWTPGIHQLGDYALRFSGDNGHGFADTAAARIHVLGVTSLSLVSDSLDVVGAGGTYQYGPNDGTFQTQKNYANGVSVTFADSLYNRWNLDFAGGSGLPLEVNVYDGAVGYPATPDMLPSLRIARNFGGCYTLNGRFVVHGVTYGAASDVPSFWATFQQACTGYTAGVRGEIRVNADVPLIVTAPRTLITSEGDHVNFTVRGLARPGANVSFGPSTLPPGSAFRDNGNATGTFDWVPGFSQRGSFSVVVAAFDGLGAVDSVRTTVIVKNTNRAPVARAGGPYRGSAGVPISFDGSGSSDPDGDTIDLQWDFGDGLHAVGVAPQHVYAANGTYAVRVFVSDGLLSATDSTTATVGPPGVGLPVITAFQPRHGRVGTPIDVIGSGFTGTTAMAFNVTAASFTVLSDTLLRAAVPSGAASGPLHVTTSRGTASSRDSFVVDPGSPVASCPRSRPDWRDHPKDWPVDALALGTLSYSHNALLKLLKQKPDDEETAPSVKLAAELIAAKFNVLAGVDVPQADGAIAAADSAIGSRHIPFEERRRERQLFEKTTSTLKHFNLGTYTPGCHSALAANAGEEGDDVEMVPGGIETSPNPFALSNRLRLMISHEARVSIRVMDIQGRVLRTLHDGVSTPGVLDLTWDGRDAGGRPLVSGVYFYRIDGLGPAIIRKVVKLE